MIDEYFSRLKEVLEVTGQLTLTDLEYCKLLTEQGVPEELKDTITDEYIVLLKSSYLSYSGEIKNANFYTTNGRKVYYALKKDLPKP